MSLDLATTASWLYLWSAICYLELSKTLRKKKRKKESDIMLHLMIEGQMEKSYDNKHLIILLQRTNPLLNACAP